MSGPLVDAGKKREEYYIPLDKAARKIKQVCCHFDHGTKFGQIVGDMVSMKEQHLRIVQEMHAQYQSIESDTEDHFKNFISGLKEKAMVLHQRDKALYGELFKEYKGFKQTAQDTIAVWTCVF